MFKGIYTALITPFKDGKVDEQAFETFVEWQIEEGVHGLVPCGTTGESPTLSHEEHNRIVDLCIKTARGRVPVMAGTGSNSTAEAIMLTRHACDAGADGALIVAPYYNKPTQEGIYQHYKAIHDAVKIPIVIYNIPGRSVINISDDTLARLSELPRIVGVKDATGDLARPYTLKARLPSPSGKRWRVAPEEGGEVNSAAQSIVLPSSQPSPKGRGSFCMLSGEDMTAVAFNASGGQGCISVTSNIMPRACADIQEACFANDYQRALELHEILVDLHSVLFCETSPGPVKFAASLMGKCQPDVRLPLVLPSEESKNRVKQVLKKLRLL